MTMRKSNLRGSQFLGWNELWMGETRGVACYPGHMGDETGAN